MGQIIRFDLIATYGAAERCTGPSMFALLSKCLPSNDTETQIALCRAIPILVTWDVDEDQAEDMVFESVRMMLSMPDDRRLEVMNGLGGLASVVLHRSFR